MPEMLTEEFFVEYPLYKKLFFEVPNVADQLQLPPLHMYCLECKRETTFQSGRSVSTGSTYRGEGLPDDWPTAGRFATIVYVCAACSAFRPTYLIFISDDLSYVIKVGQYPPWSIAVDKNLLELLGEEYEELYRKGLVCESQGYGIASFAYYRRIIENIVDRLLDQIYVLAGTSEMEKYADVVASIQSQTRAKDKIELAKELLPASLRPDGTNPLQILYERLSIGIHSATEDECLEFAGDIRQVLLYVVEQTELAEQAQESNTRFTQGIKRLLDKKARDSVRDDTVTE